MEKQPTLYCARTAMPNLPQKKISYVFFYKSKQYASYSLICLGKAEPYHSQS